MKPPPPPYLKKEEKILWDGWNMIGDREVVREAAVKGTVSLALNFLAIRKDLDNADVERWLKAEILAWVHQLLVRKQVFKASHILNNVGFEPSEQLSSTFYETTDKEMRNYIAEHLLKNNKLDDAMCKSWKFLKLIEISNSNLLKLLDEDISKLSVLKFDQINIDWKSEVATELFFDTYDASLDSYLTPETSWRYLLKTENFEIIKIWIRTYFSQDTDYDCNSKLKTEILLKLKNLFLLWPVTHFMINDIALTKNTEFFKNFVLNELSTFGIFTAEKTFKNIISRFVQNGNFENIFRILEEPTSTVRLSDYFEKLAQLCIENKFYEILSLCKGYQYPDTFIQKMNSKEFNLYISISDTLENLNNEKMVRKNILQVSNYFSEDFELYLQKNPFILLSLIFYNRDINFHDILVKKLSFKIGELNINFENILNYINLPVLKNVILGFSSPKTDFNLEDLLVNNLEIILEYLKNNINSSYYLNSSSCDFKCKIDYLYYIKRNRPSKASKVFLVNQFKKHGLVNDYDKFEKAKIIQKFALKYFKNTDIICSCISFLEMIGYNSKKLRVLINVIDKLELEIVSQFDEDPKELLNILEKKLEINENITDVLQEQKLPVKFAKLNNLELPELFLSNCAIQSNWLPFLIHAQSNHYPLDQILRLTSLFGNENLMEHLHHALSRDIQCFEEVDRGGLEELGTSMTSQYSVTSTVSELYFDSPKTNLLSVLIRCHKSEDPPTSLLVACQNYKYPLLAVLATCYEPDSVVTNWLTWLSISCNIQLDITENYAVSASTVSTLLVEAVKNKFIQTTLESFQIFMSNHPFCLLLEYLNHCINYDFKSSTNYLQQFETAVSHLKYNHIIIENDFEYMFLNNGYWIVDTALKIIFSTVGNCFDSRHQQIIFLNNLCSSNLMKNIPTECPNFCKISNLLQSLSYSDINIDLSLFWNSSDRKNEIVRCIQILVDDKKFKYALQLAKFEKILKEYVLNEEWSYNFKNRTDSFWLDCDLAFRESEILPSSASEFFVNCCKELNNCSDKYKALKLAYTWLKQSDYTDPYVEHIEQEIWSNYFALDDETLKGSRYDKNETNYLSLELQEKSFTKTKCTHTLTKEQLRHYDETIGKILESGDIIEALRLEKMFDYKSAEISILLTCYELAEGKLSPYQLSTEQRLLYMNRDRNLKSFPHRRRTHKSARYSLSTGSFSSTNTELLDQNDHSDQDTLTLLENMTDRLKHGSNIAGRILMCYRISLNLEKPYKSVVLCNDSESVLRNALGSDCKNKLEVVSDIMVIFKWSRKQITTFLTDEITKATYKSLQQNLDCITMWDMMLDNNFHLILQICSEFCSKLGEKLLRSANNIHRSHSQSSEVSEDDIIAVIELLIRSHDCFTAECNMEGISAVLRKSQTLTSTLLNLKSWKLMVRLLTGIGRYTEMNYIFQILKENDQFEYLLRKGYRKDNNLKVALLKFLKIHCPKNKKLFQMVALRFTLFSEVAELYESEAMEIIENLIEISRLEMQNQGLPRVQLFVLLTNNDSTHVCLQKAIDSFIHATEYHLHGEKTTKAMAVANQAELVALQIALLKSIQVNKSMKCILRIDKTQIQHLLLNDLSFPHSKILLESYNFQPDWGTILFQRCILNSDLLYLNEFLKAYPLTNTLAQDLTRRFLSENVNSHSSIKSMKELINKIKSVQIKYRIASELGFTDVIESLLNTGSSLAYLKDTVWKKGFKQV